MDYIGTIAFQIEGMTSSVDTLREFFMNLVGKSPDSELDSDTNPGEAHWTPVKIAKLLNIEVDRTEQPEANVLFKLFAGKDMLTFDNHTIKVAPKCK